MFEGLEENTVVFLFMDFCKLDQNLAFKTWIKERLRKIIINVAKIYISQRRVLFRNLELSVTLAIDQIGRKRYQTKRHLII